MDGRSKLDGVNDVELAVPFVRDGIMQPDAILILALEAHHLVELHRVGLREVNDELRAVAVVVLTVLEGKLTLTWQGGCRKLKKGESLYVPCAAPALTLTGNGRAALSMPR